VDLWGGDGVGCGVISAEIAGAGEFADGRGEKWGWVLLVHGKAFLMRGGELGNSSAGTAAQADEILPRLRQMHLNTVLMPVSWEQVEPVTRGDSCRWMRTRCGCTG